jgi:hypothetical protein
MDCDVFMKNPDGVEEQKDNILLVVGRLYSTAMEHYDEDRTYKDGI